MSRNMTEGTGYEVHLEESSKKSLFSQVTNKVSTGLEQLAGVIDDKLKGFKGTQEKSKIADIGHKTVDVLNNSASYVKQADLEQVQNDLRSAIKRNPERSILIGLGVGILLGGIFRKRG